MRCGSWVQEKNAYEYERVMDILRYYRELVVERKLPGACLPCKRRKSKPLVSADPVHTRPLATTASSRTMAVAASQYVARPVAMTAWRPLQTTSSVVPGVTSTAAGSKPSGSTAQVPTSTTSRPAAMPPSTDLATASHDHLLLSGAQTVAPDEPVLPPSRASSVELGTVRSSINHDDQLHHFTRDCRSAPCSDDGDPPGRSPLLTDDDDDHQSKRPSRPPCASRRRRAATTQRRSVDLRRFVNSRSAAQSFLTQQQPPPRRDLAQTDSDDRGGGEAETLKDELPAGDLDDVASCAWTTKAESPPLPVKHIATHTTDTVVVKWTKAHLAICGPYQSWT